MTDDTYLSAAVSIGERLCRQARWQGKGACTWQIGVTDRSRPGARETVPEEAGGDLYQGAAGIALFLAELHHLTGDESSLSTAEAGLAHALKWAAAQPAESFGFHSGRTGVAWAAVRAARLLERPHLRQAASELLDPLLGKEGQDYGQDVIGGAAGAVPALLALARDLERDDLLESACRLGDSIVARAHREPGGWSWRTMTDTVVHNLTGLAHGASGFALALLELAAATGDGRYRFAAEMALLYESRFFDEKERNWPDLRNQALGDFRYYGRGEALRRAVVEGRAPAYRYHCMTAWCHGSPGIGLARLRAFELTEQERYREEARAALASTLAVLTPEALEPHHGQHGSYSLCHGHVGNCELPLYAARLLGEDDLLEPCRRVVRHGIETFEDAARPWPSGTMSRGPDPSLMLGEAGVGHFFLRLTSPEIPSPLILRPEHGAPSETAEEGFRKLAEEAVQGFFGSTLAALGRLGVEVPEIEKAPLEEPLRQSPVHATAEALLAHVRGKPLLEDAFALDMNRYEETLALADFSQEFLRRLVRPAWSELSPEEESFLLPAGVRLVATERDWRRWLAAPVGETPAEPPEEESYHVLFRHQDRIGARQVGPFAALLLDALKEPRDLESLVGRAAEALDLDGDPARLRASLGPKILGQVKELYEIGFVDAASGVPKKAESGMAVAAPAGGG